MSNGNGDGGGWWDDLVADWKQIWNKIVDFFGDLRSLAESAGGLVLSAVELGREFARFIRRHSGWWVSLPVAAGLTSPLTGGWGFPYLAAYTLGTWIPVALVPLIAIVIRAGLQSAEADGRRRFRNRQPEPEVDRELAVNAKLRQMADDAMAKGKAGKSSGARSGIPVEADPLVHDVLSAGYVHFIREHSDDVVLALLERTPDGLALLDTRGFVAESLQAAIELPWDYFLHPYRALEDALESTGYQCQPIPFSLGRRHFVLLGLSGLEIAGLRLVELSRTVTDMVGAHVFGDEVPEWMVAEA